MEKLGIHASETAWVGTKFDAVLDNNGTLDDLYQQVKALATSPAQDLPVAK
jgi:dephospho-CoA kinase